VVAKIVDETDGGAGGESTGTIVAGREAHEVEGEVDRS
jgi:hypothetical protein